MQVMHPSQSITEISLRSIKRSILSFHFLSLRIMMTAYYISYIVKNKVYLSSLSRTFPYLR
jgi:hypothetical protein